MAAPVFSAPDTVAAALTLVRIRREVDDDAIKRLTELAIASARKVSERLQAVTAKETATGPKPSAPQQLGPVAKALSLAAGCASCKGLTNG